MNELRNFYIEVAKVAYDLFEKRGKVHGHDKDDWLKAEMIVKKRYEKEPGRGTPSPKPTAKEQPVKKLKTKSR